MFMLAAKWSLSLSRLVSLILFLIELSSLAYQVMETKKCIIVIVSMALFEALKVSFQTGKIEGLSLAIYV